jgi:large subunit ribosomal protein L18
MNSQQRKNSKRYRRQARVRKTVRGTATRPRLSVFRSLREVRAQLINDAKGVTLMSVTTQGLKGKQTKTEAAATVGEQLAQAALKAGIKQVVFDRSYYKFHGRIKALADAARKQGLVF